MFELKKAGSGLFDRSQNMGPNYGNLFLHFWTVREVQKLIWVVMLKLCIKLCFGVYKTGNGYEIRFQKVKPRSEEWASHGQPTTGFLDC